MAPYATTRRHATPARACSGLSFPGDPRLEARKPNCGSDILAPICFGNKKLIANNDAYNPRLVADTRGPGGDSFFGTCDVEHQRSMDYELKTIIMKTYAVAPTWRHGYLAYTL